MASTDTRSGFRLPWSSDRSHDEATPAAAVEPEAEPAAEAGTGEVAWPASDFNRTLGLNRSAQRAPEEASPQSEPEEAAPMVDVQTATSPAPGPVAAARRPPSKLMADLSAAIRATAEAARGQALAQVQAEVGSVVETLRARSVDGERELRQRSEADIAGIREWSKAEIARIKEETEARIAARRTDLDGELAAHAAAVERRVEDVNAEVMRFEAAMASYLERLNAEEDPARLATMAEEMPDAPAFAAWADPAPDDASEPTTGQLDDADVADGTAEPAHAWAEPVADATGPDADADAAAVLDAVDTADVAAVEHDTTPDMTAEATFETADAPTDIAPPDAGRSTEEPATDSAAAEPVAEALTGTAETDAASPDGDDVPRWAAGDVPDGFPADDAEAGDPVDRGAIMAALEAAAEAVVAAEAAAESADQAEAAADVAETAAELLVGRTSADDEADPEAAAAMAARVDAGGFDTETFADRLASLLPGKDAGAGDEERTTQVIVAGLVSVASIASFKRHLGRLPGVQGVAVASGPDGEFLFNVTHRADLSFRDALPTMPGFAARVTNIGDGIVNVTARDPEAEG